MSGVHLTPQWQDISAGFAWVDISLADNALHAGGASRGIEARKRIAVNRPETSDPGEAFIVGTRPQQLVARGGRLWLKSAQTQFDAIISLTETNPEVISPPNQPAFIAPDRGGLAGSNPAFEYVYLGEQGREGWFRWDANNLATAVVADPFQGVYIPPTSNPTGVEGAWVRVRDRNWVNIEWFGAKEWSFGDFTPNMQSALDFAGAETGECYIPPKIFMQSATLQMKKGCWLHGGGNWATGYRPLATRTGSYGSRLSWTDATVTGADAMAQVLVESSPQGTQLMQPRVSDLIVDGNAKAGYGVWISASQQPVVRDVWAEQHIVAGVAFLPRGATCIGPIWDNIFTNTRTSTACSTASGLVMDATSTTGYNTGGHGGYLRASSTVGFTGWGMKLGNQDAFLMDKMEIFGFSGQGIWFTYDAAKGGGQSKKHIISYFAGGMIKTDAGCSGIEIGSASETTVLNLHPDSQLAFRTIDQTTGDAYRTLSYKFLDEHDLLPGAAALTGATLSTVGDSQAISFAAAAADSAIWTHTAPPDWNHGRIMGLRIIYGMSTADAGKQCRLKLTVSCPRTNGTTSANGTGLEFVRSETFTLTAPAIADTFYTQTLDIGWPPEFKKRCAVVVTLQRMADGSETIILDNSTQALKIVSIKEMYKTDGPNANALEAVSTTMGHWETGTWSRETGYSESIGGPFSPSSGFETEAQTVIDAFSPTPWTLQQILINTTVKALKDAGLWTALDLLYLLGPQEKPWSIINWIAPGTNSLTEITAAPRHTRLQGYRSMNNGYLSAGIAWNALTKYQRDSAHVGAFVFTEAAASGSVCGATTGSIAISPRIVAGDLVTICNCAGSQTFVGNPSSRGHFVVNRSGAAGYDQWVRGVKVASPVVASTAVVSDPVVICRAIQVNITHDVAAFHCGRALTSLEIVNLNRILAYHVGHMVG